MEPVNNSNLEAVPHIVDESAKQVSINMLTALMAGQQAKLNFTRLVEKHVTAEWGEGALSFKCPFFINPSNIPM